MSLRAPIKFGVATQADFINIGIMGLPSIEPQKDAGFSVMHEAMRQGILDQPVFTMYMRKCPLNRSWPDVDCTKGGKQAKQEKQNKKYGEKIVYTDACARIF